MSEQLGLFDVVSDDSPAPKGAEEVNDPRPSDHAARLLAQTEFERPLLVEAGAGTGKTTTLTARILAWSLGPGWERSAAAEAERLEDERRRRGTPRDKAPEIDPERIAAQVLGGVVAITFTEAAAAEMAQRVGEGLAHLVRPEDHGQDGDALPVGLLDEALTASPAERRVRARALLGALDHLTVRTIHAYCRSLLAAHPLEAGLHPALEVDTDGALTEQVAREVVERRVLAAYADGGNDDVLALARRGHGPAELVEAVVELVVEHGARRQDFFADPFGSGEMERLVAELAAAVDAVQGVLGGRDLTGSPTSLEVTDALAASGRCLVGGSGFEALDRVRDCWGDSLTKRLKEWARGRLNKTETKALAGDAALLVRVAGDLVEHLRRLADLDPELLGQARRVLSTLVGDTRDEMRRRGIVTFNDLLAEARDLLVSRPEVAATVRRRTHQLLVDEFQDTDRLQTDIVARLGLDGGDPSDGGAPGLFLVGDPKQSIYGWRSADLAAYDAFAARIEAAGGLVVSLTENFRSVPAILAEVERAVAPVMTEETGLQPPFVALTPSARKRDLPGFSGDGWAPVEHWVSWGAEEAGQDGAVPPPVDDTRSVDATRLEADAIARDMARLHGERGVDWQEMALLLRSTGDLETYLEALRDRGVPFAVTGDRQYFRRREVIDAAALVRAVLDPGDHLALVTWLRSPVVGLPDAALLPLWQAGFPGAMAEISGSRTGDRPRLARMGEIVERAAGAMPPADTVPGLDRLAGWDRALVSAVRRLADLRAAFREEPADRFVERLRRSFPAELVASARYLGAFRLANLERFFRLLGETLETAEGDRSTLLRMLRRGVAEAREQEEGRPESGATSAVQVMTIHKAKGLDFGHVYLAQLHKTSPPDSPPPFALSRVAVSGGGGDVEYRLFGAPTPGMAAVERAARETEAAERVRTLYVAMTRPKERLVMAGKWNPLVSSKVKEVHEATCFLDLLAAGFDGLALDELWDRAGRSGTGRVDWREGRWVFPALVGRSEVDGAVGVSGEGVGAGGNGGGETGVVLPSLPSVEEVRAVARELGATRQAARERMARPVAGAASEEAHHRLAERVAERRFGEEDGVPVERDVAQAVGTVVHRLLEEVDLEGLRSLLPESSRSADLLAAAGLSADRIHAGVEHLERVVRGIESGPLLGRLREIAPHVVARELAVLLPPSEEDEDGAVGYVAGSVDLVFRDPETGGLVVVDYKTDEISEGEVAERAEMYRPQLDVYRRAVGEGVGLDELPRGELWFLVAGVIVRAD